jgi:N utilization substance protein B|tara:strand:- start:36 stop:467 length:432 start_codon:yes stop_codon:yes gene_type:complete
VTTLRARQKARRLVVQALYSWEIGGIDVSAIESHFLATNDMEKVDTDLFHDILFGVATNWIEIDQTFEPYLDRNREHLDPVSRAVLRLSTFEMLYSIQVPYKVVINEAVNLAKTFGPEDAFKFINGVLDKVAVNSRAIEVADR